MKRLFPIIFLVVILFAACSPSPEEIALQTQTAQKATAASWTKTPTITPTHTFTHTPSPTPTDTPMPTKTPTSTSVPCSHIDLTGKWRGFVHLGWYGDNHYEIIIDLDQNQCEVSGIYSTWSRSGKLWNVNIKLLMEELKEINLFLSGALLLSGN